MVGRAFEIKRIVKFLSFAIMAWIAMYLLPADVELLNEWLNEENEIAFLVSNGQNKWIAQEKRSIIGDINNQMIQRVHQIGIINFAEYNLWHIPSGQLPLLSLKEDNSIIADPWKGWIEERGGRNRQVPYFGAGHPGIINLKINLSASATIPMSNFGWIGNHYRPSGSAVDKSTEVFWKRLRRSVKKIAVHIPRGNIQGGKNDVFAFPAAYQEIQNGRTCSVNP